MAVDVDLSLAKGLHIEESIARFSQYEVSTIVPCRTSEARCGRWLGKGSTRRSIIVRQCADAPIFERIGQLMTALCCRDGDII